MSDCLCVKLFDVKHLVDTTIEFVHAFLENIETAKEVLKDMTAPAWSLS